MNPPAEPVHHRSQMHKTTRQRDVGNVHGSHLVRPADQHAVQKIWVNAAVGLQRSPKVTPQLCEGRRWQMKRLTTACVVPRMFPDASLAVVDRGARG